MSIKIKQGALLALLSEDGIKIPSSGGSEKSIRCFSPSHHDTEPSMSVNIVKGMYFCHGCGIKGDAYTYLTEIRGMLPKEAADLLTDDHEWSPERLKTAQDAAREASNRKKGLPKLVDEPYTRLGKGKIKAIATHDYKALDGSLIVRVQRFSRPPEDFDGRKPPKVMPFTPASRGGWWVCSPLNKNLPDEDQRITKVPLYRLQELEKAKGEKKNSPIWVVEGEKCVDAVLGMNPAPKDGVPPCTTLFGGSKQKFDQHDLAPLMGERVLLVADTDAASRAFMLRLGDHLVELGSPVKFCLPDGEGGYDVADAIAEGGWKACFDWMKPNITDRPPPKERKSGEKELLPPMTRTEHFRVLGYAQQDRVAIQKTVDHSIRYFPDTALGSIGTLLSIAPHSFWLEQCGSSGLTTVMRASFADALIRAAERQGSFDDTASVYGRGAVSHQGKVMYNMGSYLLMENEKTRMLDIERGLGDVEDAVFTPGPNIQIAHSTHVDAVAQEMYDAVMDYRWDEEMHGRAFLGWLVTSIIGGALPFRPALWMLGPAASGKTWLLENVVGPVLGNLLRKGGDVTEAGLSGVMGNDALPVYLDEFEPGTGPNAQAKHDGVMGLFRMATGGEAERIRANMGSAGSARAHPRFSLMISSVRRRSLDHASLSRFYMIRLARAPKTNWPEIRDRIMAATTREKMLHLRSHIIQHAPKIVRAAGKVGDEYPPHMEERDRLTLGALTVGAGFLSDDARLVYRSKADELTDDAYAPLDALLSALVIVEGSRRLSVSECLVMSLVGEQGRSSVTEEWERTGLHMSYGKVVERHGLKLCWDRDTLDSPVLYIARGPGKMVLLERTEYANLDLDSYLSSLPHFFRPSAENPASGKTRALRIMMAGRQVTVAGLRVGALEKVGLWNDAMPQGAKQVFDNIYEKDRWDKR